jgi:replicative DNA helicase
MAIASDTPVPTPDGWVLAGDLKPGDVLFSPRGGHQTIGSVQGYIPGQCYRVEMDDGTFIVGDRHAGMMLQDKKWRCNQQSWFRNQGNKFAQSRFRRPLKKKTFAELHRGPLLDKFGRKMWSLQTVSPLEYPSVNLPVPPYVVGLWLGSVTSTGRHWLGEKDFNLLQRRVREVGFTLARKKKGDWMFSFRPSVRESFTFAGAPIPDLIPQSYLESDVDSRKKLLQGLLDANDAKKIKKSHNCYSISDSWSSIRRKQQLLEGLGYVTSLHKITGKTNYSLFFTKMSENPAMCRRFVTNVEKITPKQCIHVAVEGEFVAGEGFLAVC